MYVLGTFIKYVGTYRDFKSYFYNELRHWRISQNLNREIVKILKYKDKENNKDLKDLAHFISE